MQHPFFRKHLTILIFPLLFRAALADVYNITMDNQFMTLTPPEKWNTGQNCTSCWARPDATKAYMNTWSDTIYDSRTDAVRPAASVSFTGTAIYIFCILANKTPMGNYRADYTFTLDGVDMSGVPGGRFTYEPQNTTDYVYNVPVYVNSSLENAKHTVSLNPESSTGTIEQTLVLLDYIVYTSQSDTSAPTSSTLFPQPTSRPPSSSPNISNATSSSSLYLYIFGGVVGGLILLIFLYCLARNAHAWGWLSPLNRWRSRRAPPPAPNYETRPQQPASSNPFVSAYNAAYTRGYLPIVHWWKGGAGREGQAERGPPPVPNYATRPAVQQRGSTNPLAAFFGRAVLPLRRWWRPSEPDDPEKQTGHQQDSSVPIQQAGSLAPGPPERASPEPASSATTSARPTYNFRTDLPPPLPSRPAPVPEATLSHSSSSPIDDLRLSRLSAVQKELKIRTDAAEAGNGNEDNEREIRELWRQISRLERVIPVPQRILSHSSSSPIDDLRLGALQKELKIRTDTAEAGNGNEENEREIRELRRQISELKRETEYPGHDPPGYSV